MEIVKKILTILSFGIFFYGLIMVIWPLPYYLLMPEDCRYKIINWIYGINGDKNIERILSSFWFTWHLPWGLLFMIFGYFMIGFIKPKV